MPDKRLQVFTPLESVIVNEGELHGVAFRLPAPVKFEAGVEYFIRLDMRTGTAECGRVENDEEVSRLVHNSRTTGGGHA